MADGARLARLEAQLKADEKLAELREIYRRDLDKMVRATDKERRKNERDARQLERSTQTYKDNQANELRTQLAKERGEYVLRQEYQVQHQSLSDRIDTGISTLEATVAAGLAPLTQFMQEYHGAQTKVESRRSSANLTTNVVTAVIIALGAVVTALIAIHG